MDDLIAATVAENCYNFTALMPGDQADVAAPVGGQAASGLGTATSPDHDTIAALKSAFNPDHAGRQQALAIAEGAGGPGIDAQHAGRVDRAGHPGLARRARLAAQRQQRRPGPGL